MKFSPRQRLDYIARLEAENPTRTREWILKLAARKCQCNPRDLEDIATCFRNDVPELFQAAVDSHFLIPGPAADIVVAARRKGTLRDLDGLLDAYEKRAKRRGTKVDKLPQGWHQMLRGLWGARMPVTWLWVLWELWTLCKARGHDPESVLLVLRKLRAKLGGTPPHYEEPFPEPEAEVPEPEEEAPKEPTGEP